MENYSKEPLYSVAKTGKINCWNIWTYKNDSGTASIEVKYGAIGNKVITKTKLISKGKNIGKSNETTPFQQACNDIDSDWTKKLKEGYKTLELLKNHYNFPEISKNEDTTINVLNQFKNFNIVSNTDHNNRPKPMLAEKYKKHTNKVIFPVFEQPKYDGMRCFAFIENGETILLSREGEVLNLPHIQMEAQYALQYMRSVIGVENPILDGEIYLHGTLLQDIIHLVRSPLLCGTLEYHVYDAPHNTEIWQARWERLRQTIINRSYTFIKLAEQNYAKSHTEIKEHFAEWKSRGFEGSILRNINGKYSFGFRDTALLKVKTTIGADFKIIGHSLESGKPLSDFVWRCETPDGKIFEVKPHGTVEQRIRLYRDASKYYNIKLQLEFHEYTKDMIPFHITSVIIRNYE